MFPTTDARNQNESFAETPSTREWVLANLPEPDLSGYATTNDVQIIGDLRWLQLNGGTLDRYATLKTEGAGLTTGSIPFPVPNGGWLLTRDGIRFYRTGGYPSGDWTEFRNGLILDQRTGMELRTFEFPSGGEPLGGEKLATEQYVTEAEQQAATDGGDIGMIPIKIGDLSNRETSESGAIRKSGGSETATFILRGMYDELKVAMPEIGDDYEGRIVTSSNLESGNGNTGTLTIVCGDVEGEGGGGEEGLLKTTWQVEWQPMLHGNADAVCAIEP